MLTRVGLSSETAVFVLVVMGELLGEDERGGVDWTAAACVKCVRGEYVEREMVSERMR